MPKGTKIDPKKKEKAIAEVLGGANRKDVAKKYGIPERSLYIYCLNANKKATVANNATVQPEVKEAAAVVNTTEKAEKQAKKQIEEAKEFLIKKIAETLEGKTEESNHSYAIEAINQRIEHAKHIIEEMNELVEQAEKSIEILKKS